MRSASFGSMLLAVLLIVLVAIILLAALHGAFVKLDGALAS